MIAARESISEFIKAKVTSDLSGITVPEMKFSVRASNQAPEFPNTLNLYFYDDSNADDSQFNPHYRSLAATLELLIQVEPSEPLVAEKQAYQVCHLVNQFLAVQSMPKKDYSVNPATSMGSSIAWRDSYPVEWITAPNQDERYIQKSAFLLFRYFEEPIYA